MKIPALAMKFVNDTSASYWFVPTCMVVCAVMLAFISEKIDVWFSASDLAKFLPLVDTQSTGARAILSTIAGSIIGVAGVTFSVTMVAVSFASANFGPRLIGNFMRDRGNQMTLGVFIGTFVYALLILRTVRAPTDQLDAFVPNFSVLIAVALALTSVGMLIYYIHHVPETINVSNISAGLGRDLHQGIRTLFPDDDQIDLETKHYDWVQNADEAAARRICAAYSGYIQTLDDAKLAEVAQKNDLRIIVKHVPGDFVTPGDAVLSVWSEGEVDNDLAKKLHDTFALGDERTKYQNVGFVAEQLVEIIARAMSPGINDPYTAISCLNWLRSGLEDFAQRETNARQPTGEKRVFVRPIAFVELLEVICSGSRQHVAQNGMVTRHMMSMLAQVGEILPIGPRRMAVRDQLERLYISSNAVLSDPSELEAISSHKAELDERLNLVGFSA